MSGATARIDTAAIRHNLGTIRNLAPHSRVMAVIKANAYGHGLVTVASALTSADALAVARIEEAVAIREAGIETPLILLEGVQTPAQLEAAREHDLELVIHVREQLEMLERWRNGRFTVWLKFDSGMHRLGFSEEQFPEAWRRLSRCAAVEGKPRLMSHFSSADQDDETTSIKQISRFAKASERIDGLRSMANSAAILKFSQSHYDWVRPGIMLYGVSPLPGRTGPDLGLEPAMELSTRLVAVNTVRAGEHVGYGGRWVASTDTEIGIAAIGYGDGYPWSLPDGTPILVNGRPCVLAGRVSMDMIAIDLGSGSNAKFGDQVVLWGRDLPVERIAEKAKTIPYELLCGITQRVNTTLA